MLAKLEVEEVWQPDLEPRPRQVFGTDRRPEHPAVHYLLEQGNEDRSTSAASSRASSSPVHYDFRELRLTPGGCVRSSPGSAGAVSWPSRRATRCTVRTTS